MLTQSLTYKTNETKLTNKNDEILTNYEELLILINQEKILT